MKKYIFMLLSAFAVFSCHTKNDDKIENEYRIYGQLNGVPDSTIISLGILYDDMGMTIANDTIVNGMFYFSDSIGENTQEMFLIFPYDENDLGTRKLWVAKGDIRITGDSERLSHWHIDSKIPEQIEENKLLSKTLIYQSMKDSLYLLMKESYLNNNRYEFDRYEKQRDSLSIVKLNVELKHFKENYNSLVAVKHLSSIAKSGDSLQIAEIKEFYHKIDTAYTNNSWGKDLENCLNKPETPQVGEKYVDFQSFDIDDNAYRISDFSDKHILLNFGFTGCSGCIAAKPRIKELHKQYKDKLHIIDINTDKNKDFWVDNTKNDSLDWLSLSDGKGSFGGAALLYDIDVYPTFILIDKNGIIIERTSGSDLSTMKEKIKEVLAE